MDIWMVLLVALGAYWALVALARTRGWLPSFANATGPILTLHTKRGKQLLDWLATPKRAWRAWGNFGLGMTLVMLVGVLFVLVLTAATTLANPPEPSAVTQPRNALIVPGVNDFLPLSVAPEIVAGLFVGILVHEFGHGIMSRVGDIEVASMGAVMLAVIPIAAFVEPDEKSQQAADRGTRARMFAAGVTNNFLVVVLAFGLLFGPVAGAVAVADGGLVGSVYDESPAATAGVDGGDRVVAVGGEQVANNTEFRDALRATDERSVTVTLASGEQTTVQRELLVTGIAADSPLAALDTGSRLTTVNDTAVYTQSGLEAAVEDRPVATFTTDSGASVTAPAGAFVTIVPDAPADEAGLPAGGDVVVVAFDGERVASGDDFRELLDEYAPGDTVSVTAYANGTEETYEVTLGEQDDGSSYFGGAIAPGVSGMGVTDFGAELYPADSYLSLVSGDIDGSAFLTALFGGAGGLLVGFLQGIVGALYLPFIGFTDPTLPFNFAGFAGVNTGFYAVQGPLSVLPAGVVFVFANLLLWTGWINLNLGIFNCIPAFPLDGGHLLRMCAEAVTARLPVDDRRAATRAITTSIGLLMLASLLVMLFGPQLLSS